MRFQQLIVCAALLLGTTVACEKKPERPPIVDDPPPPATVASTAADRLLLDRVQQACFRYFWDNGHPASGMARERDGSGETVTTGGTGFGVQAMVVAVSRGWISRTEAVTRLLTLTNYLAGANRFHGAWPHWLNGTTGAVIPFGTQDDGGDLVETAFLINGLLTAQAYFDGGSPDEVQLRARITQLWEGVEWDWYASRGDGLLYWHWSPRHAWALNLPIRGWNEGLVIYLLALASPTHPISPAVYQNTWAASLRNQQTVEGYTLTIGPGYGGPLFFAHYSFLSLDPRLLADQYTNYWQHQVRHALVNRSYCLNSAPQGYGYYAGYWGLTASDTPGGYKAHQPTDDNGTVAPTAALASMPYVPYYAMQVLRNLYNGTGLGTTIGPYGPYDALNRSRNWVSNSYLAIDQGPIVGMIENYRSGLLWRLFTGLPVTQLGLQRAGISRPTYPTGFYLAVPEVRSGACDLLKHPDQDAYIVDVALAAAGRYSLTLVGTGSTTTPADSVWTTTQRNAGTYSVPFGRNTLTGSYTLRLRGPGVTRELSVNLR